MDQQMTTHLASPQADGHADAYDRIQSRVFEEIASTFDLDAWEVTRAAHLWDDYRVSISDLLDLKVRLEVAFTLGHIPTPMLDSWKTVGGIVDYITGRLASEAITS